VPGVFLLGVGVNAKANNLLAVGQELQSVWLIAGLVVWVPKVAVVFCKRRIRTEQMRALRGIAKTCEQRAGIADPVTNGFANCFGRLRVSDIAVEGGDISCQDAGVPRARVNRVPLFDLIRAHVVQLRPALERRLLALDRNWRVAVGAQRHANIKRRHDGTFPRINYRWAAARPIILS
jgi:hypothetical protein